jgi:hypothetical protein
MSDDEFPCITDADITPAIRDLSLRIIGLADRGELSLTFLERALVAYTRGMETQRYEMNASQTN